MARIYEIDDAERYIPINLAELIPGTQIPFEIFTNDGTFIKSLLDKGSTYSVFAQKMIEKQGLGSFYIKQGNALSLDQYMRNASKLRKLILDPHFFESGYLNFREKWFVIDKQVLNSGISFNIPLGGLRFPVFGELPFGVDSTDSYKHLLDLNSEVAVRKQDVNAYYIYLDMVQDAEWIEDPFLKMRARREKLKIWCHRVLEEAANGAISQETLMGLYKHISINITLLINELKHAGKFLFFDVSDVFVYIHSTNVCLLSLLIGHLLKLEEAPLLNLGISAMLHDVGRTSIGEKASEGSSNEGEREIFKSHVLKGKELLDPCKDVPKIARAVALTHHERIDGSGYMYGLTGDKIPHFSKIVGVADTFENFLVTGYNDNSIKRGKALEIMMDHGNKFDPDILKTFVHVMACMEL